MEREQYICLDVGGTEIKAACIDAVIKGNKEGDYIMAKRIKEVYIVHHSHTDVGYTDLQEQIIYNQANNIRNVISVIKKGYEKNAPEKDFKWNCETYYCVEQFLRTAPEQENRISLSL